MRRRILGWVLLIAGIAGIIMCVASIIVYGTHTAMDIETIGVYGGLGLVMFATGIEFLRHSAGHANT